MQVIPGNAFVHTPAGSAGAPPRPGAETGATAVRAAEEEGTLRPATGRPVEDAARGAETRRDLPRGSLIDIRA